MASREEQEYSSQAPAPYIGQFLQQDIFPFAQQFLRQQFQNLGEADSSPFTYTGQRVADFDPRELYGMELADQAIGSYRPYLGAQAGLLDEAAFPGSVSVLTILPLGLSSPPNNRSNNAVPMLPNPLVIASATTGS